MYIHVCTCMYVCVHMYMYIYIHVYILLVMVWEGHVANEASAVVHKAEESIHVRAALLAPDRPLLPEVAERRRLLRGRLFGERLDDGPDAKLGLLDEVVLVGYVVGRHADVARAAVPCGCSAGCTSSTAINGGALRAAASCPTALILLYRLVGLVLQRPSRDLRGVYTLLFFWAWPLPLLLVAARLRHRVPLRGRRSGSAAVLLSVALGLLRVRVRIRVRVRTSG